MKIRDRPKNLKLPILLQVPIASTVGLKRSVWVGVFGEFPAHQLSDTRRILKGRVEDKKIPSSI